MANLLQRTDFERFCRAGIPNCCYQAITLTTQRCESSANRGNPFHRSRGPLAAILPLFPRCFQFPIPLGLNLLLM